MSGAQNEHRTRSWKLLIERDLFNTYSQRINASFQYLDDNGNGFFTLKDVTERGKFVFSYLGNQVEQKMPTQAWICSVITIFGVMVRYTSTTL